MALHPLKPEEFGEGNRQKWAAIFLVVMFAIMGINAECVTFQPAPYLNFLTFIGSFLLGGLTLTAWVQANRAETLTNHEMIQSNQALPQTIISSRRDPKDFDVPLHQL